MKILAAILFIMTLNVGAQNLRSLKDVMSDMGTTFKSITLSITAGKITPQTVTDGTKLLALVKESEAITPDTILSLPNVDQAAAKVKYDQEMKDLENSVVSLNTAIAASDVATAKTILTQLGAIKKQGHTDFK